jgi:hypothetical protein
MEIRYTDSSLRYWCFRRTLRLLVGGRPNVPKRAIASSPRRFALATALLRDFNMHKYKIRILLSSALMAVKCHASAIRSLRHVHHRLHDAEYSAVMAIRLT